MNFVEGALWSESSAGTNAVGTAVAAGHAVQVFAAEHFTEPVQRWTCSAAPVIDPDTGRMLGIIDLTGDISVVNPLSLAVVVATARAVEEVLRGQLHERDDRLRARYGQLLGPASAGAALVTGHRAASCSTPASAGRGSRSRRSPPAAACSRCPRASRRSPSRSPRTTSTSCAATARRRGRRGPCLELRVLGDEPPWSASTATRSTCARATSRCSRSSRCTAATSTPTIMCAELYGDDGHPSSVRVEMSRLRRLLPDMLQSGGYRLIGAVDSDVRRVRALLDRGEVARGGGGLPRPAAAGLRRPRASSARATSSTAGCARPSSPPTTPTRCGPGCARRRARATCSPGSGCSPRWTTPTPAAAARWRARARCARSSGSDQRQDRRAERVGLASRGGRRGAEERVDPDRGEREHHVAGRLRQIRVGVLGRDHEHDECHDDEADDRREGDRQLQGRDRQHCHGDRPRRAGRARCCRRRRRPESRTSCG